MDFRLEQKDLVCLEDGTPQTVTGTQELLQRVMIRLTVPRGKFSYNAQLGSRWEELTVEEAQPQELLGVVQEALEGLEGVEVTGVEKQVDAPRRSLTLRIFLTVNGVEAQVDLESEEESYGL